MRLWLRSEHRENERRSPLTPEGASRLVSCGHDVVVEASSHRIFTEEAFKKAGCEITKHGKWVEAPEDTYILGLKELPEMPYVLKHRHIYFGHAYKRQPKADDLLARFSHGNGILLDLEYLCDNDNRRAVAFGYWAGFVGAALALTQWATKDKGGLPKTIFNFLPYTNQEHLNEVVASTLEGKTPSVLIIGAQGRCGHGAEEMCRRHGISPSLWGIEETRYLNRQALLAHDILVNCALITKPVNPFLSSGDMSQPRNLSVVSDVSCDQGSSLNPLPILDQTTDWKNPVCHLAPTTHPRGALDGVAIDNLATILPRESSECFANDLLPHLLNLPNQNDVYWNNARRTFNFHIVNYMNRTNGQTNLIPK